jgi:phosphoribosylaminoimidazolecarboxamide formyltransferase / IMP cyclohydrolase
MSKRRALLSVSDKTGLMELGRGLVERGWELLSTGGTAAALRSAGLPVTDVADVTGHPEMLDGRVKTLHPAVHGPLLARYERPEDVAALEGQGYAPIHLVAVNLYPFRETVAAGGVAVGDAMAKVDIGGPTMIRAAAKNHRHLWVVVDPSDYPTVLAALDVKGDHAGLRRGLAAKVFRHMSGYDAAVASYLDGVGDDGVGRAAVDAVLPSVLEETLLQVQPLRYGENPDQEAAFYAPAGDRFGVAALKQLHGKELSYNNLLDLDGALLALAPFALSGEAAVCIVKHTTPCGVAVGGTLDEAWRKALATDPVSAFGSVIAVNRPVDAKAAEGISELFVECLVAPAFEREALELLARKKNVRLLLFPQAGVPRVSLPVEPEGLAWWKEASGEVRSAAWFLAAHGRLPSPRLRRGIYGGVLVQTPPAPPFHAVEDPAWKVVTRRAPSVAEAADLRFAWAAVAGVKSNAILLARDGASVGIGAGQMSRVDASRLAAQKAELAGLSTEGAVLASDAFFPFRDGVDAAAMAGVRAIVQPGGSVRDEEVVAAADEHGIAMVFTGRRLFRH